MTKAFGQADSRAPGTIPLPHAGLDQPEDTCFVIDVSGSMEGDYDGLSTKLEGAKQANITMFRQKARIDPNDRVAIVAFSDSAWVCLPMCPITGNEDRIERKIKSLGIAGGTDINEGLKRAEEVFDWTSQRVVRRIVLLTDGEGGEPIATATSLKSQGVVIDCIGIGPEPSEVNEELLRQVGSVIQGQCRYRFVKDSQTLVQHCTVLADKTAIR